MPSLSVPPDLMRRLRSAAVQEIDSPDWRLLAIFVLEGNCDAREEEMPDKTPKLRKRR